MNITDHPMPGVAEVGASCVAVIGVNDEGRHVLALIDDIPRAMRLAKSSSDCFGEIIIIAGKIEYRVWDRDEYNKVAASNRSIPAVEMPPQTVQAAPGEITPAMIEAGVRALSENWLAVSASDEFHETVRTVYEAMTAIRNKT